MSLKRDPPDEATNTTTTTRSTSVFIPARIKSRILRDEGVGRLSQKAVESIGVASAAFVKGLVESTAQDGSLTLDMVKKCVEKEASYDFLRESIGSIKEESVPRVKAQQKRNQATKDGQKKKKQKKKPLDKAMAEVVSEKSGIAPGLSSAPVQRAIADAQRAPLNYGSIVLDEDDYD